MQATKYCLQAAAATAVQLMEPTAPQSEENIVWKRWCRLCAKEDDENECIFTEIGDTIKAMDTTLATAIGKFFWVNIRPNDDLSKYVCIDCHTLITSLTQFTERVNKVQAMFCALQNVRNSEHLDFNEIKSQYGLLDIEFEPVIKHERKTKEAETNEEEEEHAMWEIEGEDEAENKETEILELEADGESKAGGEYEIEFVRRKDDDNEAVADEKPNTGEVTENKAFQAQILSLNQLVEKGEEQDDEHISILENANEEQLDDAELLKQLMGDDNEVENNEETGAAEDATTQVTTNTENNIIESRADEIYEEDEELILTEEVLENEDETAVTATPQTTTTNQLEVEFVQNSAQVHKIDSSSRVRKKRGRPFKYDTYDNETKKNKSNNNKEGATESDECDTEAYKYECPLCYKKYKSPTSYRKHTIEKHGREPDIPDFKCITCDKILPTERQLAVHSRKHLSLEEKLDIPCPFCERKFTKDAVMRQHIRGVHENLKPFVCDICGQALKTKPALVEHKLVHTNETPYECEVCHKAFKNKARLRLHTETHTDANFICTECGLKLNTSRTLKMHMLVHSDDKRYKCDHCSAAFKRTKALKNHLILHTGMRPYKCNFCDKTFSNGSNCRSHKKKIHAAELAEEEAMGKKAEVVTVPKLDELRKHTNVVGNSRKVQRYVGGLPLRMREILISAEQRVKCEDEIDITHTEVIDDDTQQSDYVAPAMEYEIENDTKNVQAQQNIIEVGEDDDDDDDDEMVVYEIIAEI